MIKLKSIKNIVYIFLVLIITFVIIINSVNIYGDALSDAQKQYDAIKAQLQQNSNNLQGVEKEINQYNYDIANLDEQITEYSIKLSDLQTKVDAVNSKISEQQQSLQEASQKYTSAENMYSVRLRSIYENGTPSVLDVLFASKGISDFFSKLNVVDSLLDYDKSLTSNMESQKEYVDYIKKDMEVQKVQLDQLTYDVNKSKQALDDAVSSKQTKVTALQTDKNNMEERNKILSQQESDAKKKMLDEMSRIAAQSSNSTERYSGNFTGMFTWPVLSKDSSNCYLITAAFADAEYYRSWHMQHTGTDIGVSLNTPVHAMADGKVVFAAPNVYGNCLIIDHGLNSDGNTYYTLYAHLNSFRVSKGQTVNKGDLVAYSGATGQYVSGAHLHIEVIKSKGGSLVSVDPMDYFASSGAPFKYWANVSTNTIIPYPFNNMSNYQTTKSLSSYISDGAVN